MSDDYTQYLAATSYEGILFPAEDVTTSGGHDSVKHTALLVPGADIESTGRKPKLVKLRIPLLSGLRGDGAWPADLFPGTYRQLWDAFDSTPIGTLTHPTRGRMTVHIDDVDETMVGGVRNGVILTVTCTEQNAESDLEIGGAAVPTDPATTATANATTADAAAAALDPSIAPFGAPTATMIATVADGSQGYREVAGAVAVVLLLAQSNLALPSVATLAGHDYRVATTLLVASVYAYQASVLGLVAPRTMIVPQTMSVARFAAMPSVYGDPSKAALLRAANNLAPTRALLAAGTVLVVPPAT